jgi:hypothetical protein
MTRETSSRMDRKIAKLFLVANLCLWIYFWIGFARASYPYEPNPLGHVSGTGFTFWGHAIAVAESGFKYKFFKTTYYVELPSVLLVTLFARIFDPHLVSPLFFGGISMGGWIIIATMMLSFFQWYFIGRAIQRLGHKWFNQPTGAGGPQMTR